MGAQGWLERYRRGEREQVWHELRQCGDRVREPDLAGDAQAVCDEMARRARHNVELVGGRLREQGYRFHTNDDAQDPVEPPALPDRRREVAGVLAAGPVRSAADEFRGVINHDVRESVSDWAP